MRILVVGTGGVGAYYGARLASAGNEVWFLARGENLLGLRERGLAVRSDYGDVRLEQVHATDDARDAGPVDAVLFCVKAYDNGPAADAASGAVGHGTSICSLQNGVDNEVFLRERFQHAVVLGGTSRIEAYLHGPGVVVQTGSVHDVTIGAFSLEDRPAAAELGSAFDHAGIPVTLAADVTSALWMKLLIIAGLGGITAYGRCSIGEALADEQLRDLLSGLLHEVEAVAQAQGIALPPGLADTVFAYSSAQLPPSFRSSMARDVEAGRPLEVEAINGAVVRAGREAGVPTPANETVLEALLPLHRAAMAARNR